MLALTAKRRKDRHRRQHRCHRRRHQRRQRRLAIQAPREVKILRGELYEAIVAENRQAAAPPPADGLTSENLHKK
jgi:hypothetical protein